MRLVFTPNAWSECTYGCQPTGRPSTVNRLIDDALPDPVAGIGEPEPLRHMLAGAWSRRITEDDRLVYLVDGDDLSAGPSDQRWHPGGVGPRSRGARALRRAGMESV